MPRLGLVWPLQVLSLVQLTSSALETDWNLGSSYVRTARDSLYRPAPDLDRSCILGSGAYLRLSVASFAVPRLGSVVKLAGIHRRAGSRLAMLATRSTRARTATRAGGERKL
ncbi:hypothetical protein L227DRAFT_394993 [Lentinus tigrinus ALCF2SS1-6]|uniref:Secreted protein n=1 Tax=Lentinus tigrinus ALCF2SS1-6 TaxID=1328759 RepID=A0A5C2SK10_9APHY|nr:hypothetical protein L227DRAFT_394993 [Lentinus tigrinus ALCF2SS1-6]